MHATNREFVYKTKGMRDMKYEYAIRCCYDTIWFLCRQKSSWFTIFLFNSSCFGYVRIDGVTIAAVLHIHTYDSKQQWHMWLFINRLLLMLSSKISISQMIFNKIQQYHFNPFKIVCECNKLLQIPCYCY